MQTGSEAAKANKKPGKPDISSRVTSCPLYKSNKKELKRFILGSVCLEDKTLFYLSRIIREKE